MLREVIPYAFVRVFNDQPTIKACLESITPAIEKGVICYHPAPPGIKTDRTLEIVIEFVKKHPGFRLIRYPKPVIPANHPIYLDLEVLTLLDASWSLANYYQFTFQELVKLAKENGDYEQAWFVKVDGDHIYCPDALNYMFNWAKADPHKLEAYFIGKLDLIYAPSNKHLYITSLSSRHDHYFYKLTAFNEFNLTVKLPSKNAWECIDNEGIAAFKAKQTPNFLNSFHFKWEKILHHQAPLPHLEFSDLNCLDDTTSENYQTISQQFREVQLCRDFFNYDNALRIVQSFDYEGLDSDYRYLSSNLDVDELLNNPIYREANFPIRTPVVILRE